MTIQPTVSNPFYFYGNLQGSKERAICRVLEGKRGGKKESGNGILRERDVCGEVWKYNKIGRHFER
jgi:hypothetical protein